MKLNTYAALGLCFCTVFPAIAQEDEEVSQGQTVQPDRRVRVIEPDQNVREARAAAIDTERFQLGAYIGTLSVEDFGTEVVTGLELSYQINSDWFIQGNLGFANIDPAAFETVPFLADEDRDFEYIGINGGYRWISGRSFLGARAKYNSDIYLLVGLEHVSFAANDEMGIQFGLSYRTVLRDWLTLNIDFREHSFKREFIGDDKQTFNTEFRIGINSLF